MAAYALTIFLSAFLLFQVQTLLAKWFLPWYGGVPAVWTGCLLFFQFALLLGYAYAHGMARLPPRWQARLHLLLVAVSLAALAATAFFWGMPLLPADAWKPIGDEDPAWHLVALLTLAVGIPFLTLSATAPLVQHWWGRARDESPYRLYALSNLGSLLGLLSYPFVFEVFVPLRSQAYVWSFAYLAFALGIAGLAWRARRFAAGPVAVAHAAARQASMPPARGQRLSEDSEKFHPWNFSSRRVAVHARDALHFSNTRVFEKCPAIRGRTGMSNKSSIPLWFALPACASVLLLAVTNQLSQEVAVVPLLWVVPLSVYLASFILCFDSDRWYPRQLYLAALVPALALMTLTLQHGVSADLVSQIVLYTAGLFVACMVLHGELARLKPAARHLTGFYLTITAGGAAGGLFVGVLAPRVFPGYWELSLALWGCAALALIMLWRDRSSVLHRGPTSPALLTLFGAGLMVTFAFADQIQTLTKTDSARSPWTYGALAALALASASVYAVTYAAARSGHGTRRLHGAWLPRVRVPPRAGAFVGALVLFGIVHLAFMYSSLDGPIAVARNFFGIVHVYAQADRDDMVWLRLRHGRTIHGSQRLAAVGTPDPDGYYARDSGIGQALSAHPLRRAGEPLRVGVVGLGAGTLAAYGRHGDDFRFYEINPAVTRLSEAPGRVFTYLRDSRAAIAVVPGDARLALERERGKGLQRFDVLVLDAFNSGSIPAHLLTTEALELYLARLAPDDGLLALHISNRFLDLRPLVFGLAQAHGLAVAIVERDDPDGESSSLWALLAKRPQTLPVPPITPPAGMRTVIWRDDYTNLLALIRLPIPERRTDSPAALAAEATALDPAR